MAGKMSGDEKRGSFLEILFVVCAFFGSIILLIWLTNSQKLVWYSLRPMLWTGAIWKWFPSDFAYASWNSVATSAATFSRDLGAVSFFSWMMFVNAALMPLCALISIIYVCLLPLLVFRRRANVFRKFGPAELLSYSMTNFSGIAPVIKIRNLIVANKLPQWRIQVTPEEVFLAKHNGRPMVQSDEFRKDVALEYFSGIKKESVGGRMASRMLGRQVVDLLADKGKAKQICFPDRLSNEGKAAYALWAAVAFGGQAGKAEYTDFCRKLNLSAYGSPTGMANLKVIQPLYDKYRKNPGAANLFAVHHWENTVLMALLEIAQRRGRYTTAEVLWLRPANRVLFFSLNSCGAKTPHVEAAATFNQFNYERACFAQKRLPLFRDPAGKVRHYVCVDQAVEGLQAEFEHWKISSDEGSEWWRGREMWRTQDRLMRSVLSDFHAQSESSVPPSPPPEESEFDRQQSDARSVSEDDERASALAALAGGKSDPF